MGVLSHNKERTALVIRFTPLGLICYLKRTLKEWDASKPSPSCNLFVQTTCKSLNSEYRFKEKNRVDGRGAGATPAIPIFETVVSTSVKTLKSSIAWINW